MVGDPPPLPPAPGPGLLSGHVPDPAPDHAAGSFSSDPPWLVDPEAMAWRAGIDALRAAVRAQVPDLIGHRRMPPLGRLAEAVARIGGTLGVWWLRERRAGPPASREAASRRLRHAFTKLGPTYIKLGQIISGGEGLFPAELVGEFKLLRDRVPPESFADVRRVVEEDLSRPLEAVFDAFERQPIAAASIAQVHAAVLRSGEAVVVKVQRPRVADLVRRDLRAMASLAPRLVGRIPIAALANPPALVELFAETIVEELDFRLEAENMLDIAAVLAATGRRHTIVPRPHPTLVTRRVLVMERLDGFRWDDVAGMKGAGVDTEAVLHDGLVAFMEGAMLHGVFHGDLHGGNLFVRPNGTTVLLDFGITGRLDGAKRIAFLLLLVSATSGDVRGQLRALVDLGAFPPETDLEAVIRDLDLDRPMPDPTSLSADELVALLQDLVRKLLGYGARAPKELMLFVKNMMFLDGAIATLAPELDILGELEKVHTEIAMRHGLTLAADLGIDVSSITFDPAAVRAALGLPPDTVSLTFADVLRRREIIARNAQEMRVRDVRAIVRPAGEPRDRPA
jgi:ubiquinone biosynthesis protein